jgi:hypothetical protein
MRRSTLHAQAKITKKGKALKAVLDTTRSATKAKLKPKLVKPLPLPVMLSDVPAIGSEAPSKRQCVRGSAGTFAGRRPPLDPEKRKYFDQVRKAYLCEIASIEKSRKAMGPGRVASP